MVTRYGFECRLREACACRSIQESETKWNVKNASMALPFKFCRVRDWAAGLRKGRRPVRERPRRRPERGPPMCPPKPRQRPPRARHRAVNSTPTRHPCPATDGAAANSPPVRSRSRLLAIDPPRLTTTGWGPGRYAARASAGPIRNSILSKHLRQLGDVRRDAAGLVPPRPARA